MKAPRPVAAKKRRPAICTSTIATAVMVLSQVSSFAPSASATTFSTPFGTQASSGVLSDGTGLIMNGGGLLLLNSANTYTGNTIINDGSVSLTAAMALGSSASTITIDGPPINGVNFQATRGGGGGNLTVGGAITIDRNIFLRGLGSTGDTGALTNVGNNTFSGSITTGISAATRIMSTVGTATFSGPIALGLGQTLQIGGNGNTLLNGTISLGSTSALQRVNGSGLLEITGTNTYGGITTISSGFLRISSAANIGTNTGNTAITSGGGTLEIRGDTPDFSTKGLTQSASGTLFFDHAVGSTVLNQTVAFRTLVHSAAATTTLNGRNGYGVTFGTGLVGTGTNAVVANQANSTITNNLNGLVTYNGDFWFQTGTAARTFTLAGSGDSLINGNIQTTSAAHIITKSGTGTLTIQSTGTGSSFTGLTNIQGGTLAINSITALNDAATGAASQINIGNTTTAGTLTFIGSGGSADYVTSKTVNLAGTTGGATINANQTVANPVQISVLSAVSVGSKTLTLGGTNTADNLISGVIANGGTGVTSLAKSGPGTWVLSGSNTYGGSTTITGGILKLNATAGASDIIASGTGNVIVFNADAAQSAGGTLQFTGVGSPTTEMLGALTPTAGMGTVRLTSGGAAANLVFTSLAGGSASRVSGVNFDTSGAAGGTVTITGLSVPTATTLPGNGHLYLNGSDFAIANGSGVLGAPVYGTTPGFVNAAAALTAGNHNLVTGDIAAQATGTVSSLKMTTFNLGLAGNVTVNTGGAANDGGILVTGGSPSITSTGTAVGLTTGGAGALVFRVNGATDGLTLSAPMLSTTTGGFTKNGAGTLILSGTNLQTGATTINEGTVQLSGTGTLSGNNQALALRQGATLDLNGVSTGLAIGAFNGAGTITNGSSAAPVTLSVGNNNGTGTFSGVITNGTGGGLVSVVKNGTGAQTWSGLNNYTGSTTINSTGIVSVNTLADGGSPSSIGASSNTADNLIFGGASATGATGGISYTGAASISIDRLFTLASQAAGGSGGGRIQSNPLNNGTANNAALIFSNTGPIVITGTTAQTLTLGGASTGDNRMGPQLVDGAGAAILNLRKDDAGLWILGNSGNSYTGTTTITNGMLQADGTTLPTGSALVIGSGTAAASAIFQSSGNFTRALGTGAGQVALLGTGSATNAGFAASSAKFNVNIGTATWGSSNFLAGNQALLLNSTTALAEVDIQSGIDLNGVAREIQVLDNPNTASDFATISGVISGTGSASGIVKTGGGLLNLNGANTYQGNTEVRAGAINVTSLGQNSGGGSSSVGASGPGAVQLGFNASAGTLDYVGAGETSSRLIQATGSSGQTTVIRSNGTGVLILSNLVNSSVAVGAAGRQIGLGGENTGPNEVTSILADAGGGPLGVVKNDGGVWIMSQQHTYTGGTTANNGGALGIAANATGSVGAVISGPLGRGTFTLGNASIMALGGDRTIINPVTLNGGATGFQGENSFTINSNVIEAASTSLNNFLPAGKTLTINGTISNDAAARTATFAGPGDTFVNGLITQAQSGTPNLSIALNATGGGSLTIGGTAPPNNYGGATTLTAGTLILDKVGAIGAAGTAAILNLNGGVLEATSDAKGVIANAAVLGGNVTVDGSGSINIQGGLTNSGGNRILTNNLDPGKTLTIGGTVNLSNNVAGRTLTLTGTGDTVVSGLIQNGGTLGSLTKGGTGTLTFTGTGSIYTGTTGILDGRVILAGGGNEHLPVGTALTLGTVGTGTAAGILQIGDASGPSTQTLRSVTVFGPSVLNAIVGGGTAISTLIFNNDVDHSVPMPIGGGSGGIDDNLKLVKTGAGNLTLTWVNSYKGGTEVGTPNGVDGGTLTLDAGTLGDIFAPAALTIYGGTVEIKNDQEITALNLGGGGPSSTAKFIVNSDLFLKGNITYSAANNPNPATIEGVSALNLNSAADTIINVGSSTAGSGGALAPDLTISAALKGSRDVHKTGAGALRLLPNVNTSLSGQILLEAGTLILDGGVGNPVLPTSTNFEVGSGTKLDLGASSGEKVEFGTLTVDSNSTIAFNLGMVGSHDFLDVGILSLGTGGIGRKLDINALTGFGSGAGTDRYPLLIEQGVDLTTSNPFTIGAKPGGYSYTLGAMELGMGTGVYQLYLDVADLVGAFFWRGGKDGNWNSQGGGGPASNWVTAQGTTGSVINGIPGVTSDVIFSADAAAANKTNTTVDVNMGVKTLTINNTAATTIKGVSGTILSIANGLTINSLAGSFTLGASGTAQALRIGVVNSQSWTNLSTTGTFTVENQIFSQSSGTKILTFDGTGPTIINGNIINGGAGGQIALSKTSASTLTLTNPDNTFTGGTKIGAGTLEFASGGLAISGAVEFTGNATLKWLGANTNDLSSRLKINNGFTATLDTNGNNVTFANPLQAISPTTGALTKAGTGTLTLAGTGSPSRYSGGTNIASGTLGFVSGALPTTGNVTFTGDSTLKWSSLNSDDISARLKIAGGVTGTIDTNGNDVTFATALQSGAPTTGALTKAGAGTLTLAVAGTPAGYSGGTNLAGGTLEFAAGALPTTGSITFTGDSTLMWRTGNTNDISSRLKIASGVTGSIDTNGNNITFATAVNFGSPSTSGSLTKTGPGILTLASNNSLFTGATTVDKGTLVVSGTISGSTSVNVSSGATFELAGNLDRILNSAPVTMGAGATGEPAMLVANGSSETMGAFTLAGDSVIDFGPYDANAQLRFGISSAASWSGTLSIWNWSGVAGTGAGPDHLFFGTSAAGLTAGQLSKIEFFSDDGTTSFGLGAGITALGEVVPVPEPGTVASLLGGFGLLLGLRRRRR